MGAMSGPVLPSDGFKPGSATLEAPRSPLPTALPAGTLLRNRYRLTGTLKIGRVAAVYRAEEAETGRPVTVQIFHELGRNDRDRIASFHRPKSSRLVRPDLPGAFVTVHACDLTDEGQLFLVTEAVQGVSLADILARTPELAPARALELATRIGEALEAALNIGLLELPLAPADIIVDDADRVKLLRSDVLVLRQLGLAAQLAAAEATERDPRYVSPEELAGLPATERSVVYRFGVLLYELLCGEVPFDGTKPGDVHDRQLRSPPRRLRDRHPTLPASLDRLASRMLDPEPMARPDDPTSILNELWEAACRFRTEAPPAQTDAASPFGTPTGPMLVRRSWMRPLGLAGLSIVVIGGASLIWSTVVRSPSPAPPIPVPLHSGVVVPLPPVPVVTSPPPPPVVPLPAVPVVISPPPVLPPPSAATPSEPDLRASDLPRPPAAPRPSAAAPGAGASPKVASVPPVVRSVTQAESRAPETRTVSKGTAPAGEPPSPARSTEAPAPRTDATASVRPEPTPANALPTPLVQRDPTVGVPPARPRQPGPDNPRTGDPAAIIEWLIGQGPKTGD
jgi:eukaryotic-like serine/threonine-protein kinase